MFPNQFITAMLQTGLTRLAHYLANQQHRWLKNLLISYFIRRYAINLHEAESQHIDDYPSFNAFFTRRLRTDVRQAAGATQIICCPADGQLTNIEPLSHNSQITAKGTGYSLEALLPCDNKQLARLQAGSQMTIYLSPKDYHRVHCPCPGRLTNIIHIPGQLFSVNPKTVQRIPDLFSRNERVACWFEGDFGPFVVILVGAMVVGSIDIFQHPLNPHRKNIQHLAVNQNYQAFEQLGCFRLGSTVIVLLPNNVPMSTCALGSYVQVGQALTTYQ